VRPYVYLEKTDVASTLTTFLYCSLWQLYAALNTGRNAYIHWPEERSLIPYRDPERFAEQPNMFDWYFQQPCKFDPCPPPQVDTWTWEDGTPELNEWPLMGMPLATIKAFYHEHLKFVPEVDRRGQELVDKYGIDFSKTLGITWRGTDNVTDGRPRLPIEIYYPFVDQILKDHPDCRIACTAEEEGILDPLLARYPQAFKIEEFFAAPLGCIHNPERISEAPGYERGMVPTLMVWLFSKCAHYVKNRSSTGAVASWLSDGNIVCLGHNENLDYETGIPIIHPETGEPLWPL
jgi:hypothetical protein